MADETTKQEESTPRRALKPESQQERWLKYGANVVLVSVVGGRNLITQSPMTRHT